MLERVYEESSFEMTAEEYMDLTYSDEVDGYLLEKEIDKISDCLADLLLLYIENNIDERWGGVVVLVTNEGYIIKFHYLTYDETELKYAGDIEIEIKNLISKFQNMC